MRIKVKKQSISKPTRCPQCVSYNSFESSTDGGIPVWKCRVPECQYTLPRTDTRPTPTKPTPPPNRNAAPRNTTQQIAERNRRARREKIRVASVVAIIIGVIGLLIAFSVGAFWKASVETTVSTGTPDASTSIPASSSAPATSSLPAATEPVWQRFERDNGYFYGYSDSLMSGYVEYHYDTGSVYKGGYKDTDGDGFFEQNGEGEYTTENYTYKGNFSYDEFNGYGEITWKSGDVYKGEWKNGVRVGTGEYYWSNGDWYKGMFVSDDSTYINGTGQYKRGDVIYEGTFTDGKLNGEGKLYTSDWKMIYDGNYKKDRFNGKGTYYFPNSGGRFTYDSWNMGETEVMYLTTNGVRTECGQWLHNDFYGLVYENDQWVSIEIVNGVKSYAGDYSWMLDA